MITDRNDIIQLFLESSIMKKWHWFRYHFNCYNMGMEHNLCYSLTDTLFELQKTIPDVHKNYIKRIASISGREKNTSDYDQLIQILSELIIIRQILLCEPKSQFTYEYEPSRGNSNKNPELLIKHNEYEIGIEVKSPKIQEYKKTRQKPIQLPSRNLLLVELDFVKAAKDNSQLTLPKDNVIKDFLMSANEKYREFKRQNFKFIGVLIIVWDEFIYEPISALLNDFTGIFTANSYIKDANGNNVKFENVDFVIITSHIDQIMRIAGDRPSWTTANFLLDYGDDAFPYKIVIKNPNSALELPDFLLQQLQLRYPDLSLGAEYQPSDFVQWL